VPSSNHLVSIMVDPLSAAGLAIGVLDVLITLGERLGDLISTAQAFEDVSRCACVCASVNSNAGYGYFLQLGQR
jgi:hypothetical protein